MKPQSYSLFIRIAALVSLIIFIPVWSMAQEAYFYTFDGEKVMLEAMSEYIVIRPAEFQEKEQVLARLTERFRSVELNELSVAENSCTSIYLNGNLFRTNFTPQ